MVKNVKKAEKVVNKNKIKTLIALSTCLIGIGGGIGIGYRIFYSKPAPDPAPVQDGYLSPNNPD
jgi:hypothetical protein